MRPHSTNTTPPVVPRRLAPSLALPPYTYIPGRYPHPVRDPRGHSHALTDDRFGTPPQDRTWRMHTAWLHNLDLFNYGYYWESHEGFEAWWRQTSRTDPRYTLFHGLVKLAACGVKLLEAQPVGFSKHAEKARHLIEATRLEIAPRDHLLGLPLTALVAAVAELESAPVFGTPIVLSVQLRPADPASCA